MKKVLAGRLKAACEGCMGESDRALRGLYLNFWKKFYPWPPFFCTLPPWERKAALSPARRAQSSSSILAR